MSKKIQEFFRHRYLSFIVLLVLVALPYLTILGNGFAADDAQFIQNWQTTRSFKNIPQLLIGDVPQGHEGIYRPLRSVLYAISYRLWGLNPAGYHLQALFLHLFIVVLLYLIIKKRAGKTLAFVTALLFGIHPITTDQIAFTTASFDILGIIFFMASFYYYLLSNFETRKKFAAVSFIFAFLAFFSNEITLTLPLIIFIYAFLLGPKKSDLKQGLKNSLPYFALLAVYFLIRFVFLKVGIRDYYANNYFSITLPIMTGVFVAYFQRLILPINLVFVPNVEEIALRASWLPNYININALLIILILILGVLFVIKNYRNHPNTSFALLWFFLVLLPISNIIPSLGFFYSERYLYLSTMSFALTIGFFLLRLYQKNKEAAIIIFTVLILLYSYLTFTRNQEWHDTRSLWTSTLNISPNSRAANLALGTLVYLEDKDPYIALTYFKKAMTHDPNNFNAYIPYLNSGVIYTNLGDFNKAIYNYKKAEVFQPKNTAILESLGFLYYKIGDYDKALLYDLQTIKINPNINADIYYDLALVYLKKNDKIAAIKALKKSVKLDSTYNDAQDLLEKLINGDPVEL